GRHTLHDERIETVKSTDRNHVQRTAFRRVGVHIVIMLEIRWIFGLVKQAGGRTPLGFHVICVNHRNCARKHSYRERTRPKSSHPASPFLFRIYSDEVLWFFAEEERHEHNKFDEGKKKARQAGL